MQQILIIILILLVLYFFLISPSISKKKKQKESQIKEGIVIRWKDPDGKWNFIKKDRNMIMSWGKVRVYENGIVEYLPESNRERIYREEPIYPFNPYLPSSWRILKSLERKGYDVFWADGTDRFESPKTFKIVMGDDNG